MIEFRQIDKSYDGLQVLNQLNLAIEKGETLALVGNSGTGKTVLVKMAIGLIRPDRGQVLVDGQEVQDLPEPQFMDIRRRVSMLFQANALFDSITVYENIAYPLREHLSMPEDQISQRVSNVLGWVNLPGIEQQVPSELSGGMKKRVGLARAIVTEPEMILYDEPTAGLDPISTTVVNRMIKRFQGERGVTSVVITHDLKSAMEVGDRVALLAEGQVVAVGPPEEVLQNPDPRVQNFFEGYLLTRSYLKGAAA